VGTFITIDEAKLHSQYSNKNGKFHTNMDYTFFKHLLYNAAYLTGLQVYCRYRSIFLRIMNNTDTMPHSQNSVFNKVNSVEILHCNNLPCTLLKCIIFKNKIIKAILEEYFILRTNELLLRK
jgi:hypothetical protein